MSHVLKSRDRKMLQETICGCTKSQVGDCRRSHKGDRMMLQKEVKEDCDCEISQLVVKVFTKLLWILDCDCKCQEYSRTSYPRRFGEKKKRKSGGAGARQRRTARRAETVRGASLPPVPPPPLHQAPPSHRAPPPAQVPPPPPRSSSLMQDVCIIDKLPPPSKLTQYDNPIYGLLENSSKEKQDLGQRRQTLNPTFQATERQTTLDQKFQATERQTTLDQKFKATEIKGSMIENATSFLNRATEQRNREAEEKRKWELIKNSPGRGFQRSQHIPANVPFCLLCRAYKKKIHFCSALDKYVNIDDRNLIMLEGDTADEVEGLISNTGKKCYMFETRKEMKNYLFERVKKEKEEEERDKGIHVHRFSSHMWNVNL